MTGKDAVIYDDEIRVIKSPALFRVYELVGNEPIAVAEFVREDEAKEYAAWRADKKGLKLRA